MFFYLFVSLFVLRGKEGSEGLMRGVVYHRITECQGLKGTLKDHQVQSPCLSRNTYIRCLYLLVLFFVFFFF